MTFSLGFRFYPPVLSEIHHLCVTSSLKSSRRLLRKRKLQLPFSVFTRLRQAKLGTGSRSKVYYHLIGVLCGVERVNFALKLFESMKRSAMGGYRPIYDVLIPKLCRGGNFEKGKALWDEAVVMGVSLQCSTDVLDPSVTEVFKPTREVE